MWVLSLLGGEPVLSPSTTLRIDSVEGVRMRGMKGNRSLRKASVSPVRRKSPSLSFLPGDLHAHALIVFRH
jgi:hypothetical protein